MITISRNHVKDLFRMEILARMGAVQAEINLFEQKYSCAFEEFETRVLTEEEDFEQWDDYMAWKACQKVKEDISVY